VSLMVMIFIGRYLLLIIRPERIVTFSCMKTKFMLSIVLDYLDQGIRDIQDRTSIVLKFFPFSENAIIGEN
jgi:hypothetical protein